MFGATDARIEVMACNYFTRVISRELFQAMNNLGHAPIFRVNSQVDISRTPRTISQSFSFALVGTSEDEKGHAPIAPAPHPPQAQTEEDFS